MKAKKAPMRPRIALVWTVVSTRDDEGVMQVCTTEHEAKRALGMTPGWYEARLEARYAIVEGETAHLLSTEQWPLHKSTR